MNSQIFLKSVVCFAAVSAFSAASGQFSFDVPAVGSVNVGGGAVSVEGKVDFDLANNTVIFEVTNTSSVASEITQVYLLKPFGMMGGGSGVTNFSVSPSTETNVNKQWKVAYELDNDLAQYFPSGTAATDYFGANDVSPSSPDTIESTPVHETTVFTFQIPGLNAYAEQELLTFYGTAQQPTLGFRWQTIEDNGGEVFGGSAKGYGFLDIRTTAVPEPSQIAALSMLGLGGLLLIRRRIIRKGKKA